MSSEHILIVEDDPSILNGLQMNLEMEGYAISIAKDGRSATDIFEEVRPDLVILDIMLPKLNGFEVLERIRDVDPDTPVLMLSARDQQVDKVLGLKLGADDYMTKPFDLAELLARINAALRRKRIEKKGAHKPLNFGDVHIDRQARQVIKDDAEIEMTAREYDLLVYLAEREGRVVTRAQALDGVWGDDYEGTDRTVDNFIARLRTKIEANPDTPEHIVTVRGVGYRFVSRP